MKYNYKEDSLDLLLRLRREIKKFNLNDFYHNKGLSDGAVCLITPKQMIMTDTFIKSKENPSYGTHEDTIDFIYKVLYARSPLPDSHDKSFNNWQDNIILDGNVVIQLCSNALSEIWIPNIMTEGQINYLEEFNNRIKQVINDDLDYFRENPIKFIVTNGTYSNMYENDIDEFIDSLKVDKEIRR